MALPVRAANEVFLNALIAAKLENFLNSRQLFPKAAWKLKYTLL